MNNKIDIAVLVTSISQRDIAIETVNYYSKICSNVVFVDEEKTDLNEAEKQLLSNKNILYIPYKSNSKNMICTTYEKRLIAAKSAKNSYVVHSNHDERYTRNGLQACVNELKNNKELTFCAGQAIALRRNDLCYHYTQAYANLKAYKNIGKVEERLYYHAKNYAPIAHYSVWIKDKYIDVTKQTISIHESIPISNMMDEVVFELASDLSGNSSAIPQIYWIRNRINPPSHDSRKKGSHVFKIIENKLKKLFNDTHTDSVQMDLIIKSFWNNFPFVRPTIYSKTVISIKKIARFYLVKKKYITDVDNLLNENKILFEKRDLSAALNTMMSQA